MPTPSSTCPRCQSPIPADAPGGICPACALLGVAEPTDPGQAAAAGVPTLEELGAAFPEYEVLEIIGHGGMGVVFKARQPRLDRLVALKILPPALAAQPGFAERFTREARALARLAHPHIVGVYDFGERAGFYYLMMEFVDGVNLRQALRAGVTPEQALQLVPHICEALQFAHDHGVLHRDIKPENILLDRAGVPKLADFGIAKMAGDRGAATGLTSTGAALGTVAYMAPEQIEKPATVDHRADIYSLGVVLYEMLTGELPLGRFAAPSEKSHVGLGVDEVVMRALEKERGKRQQSATEMKTQVEHASTQPGSVAKPLRASKSFTSTPEHRFSLRGYFYIYTGKGHLTLDESTLTYLGDGEPLRIPLRAIREIGIGHYSGIAKPVRLDFFSVVWEDADVVRTRLFTPYESLFSPTWETNSVVAEWAGAVRASAGRVLGREPAFVASGALGTSKPSVLHLAAMLGIPLLIAAMMMLFFAVSGSGYGFIHSLKFCALLAALAGVFVFFWPKARPATATASTTKEPAHNPWPRRVFWLILTIVVAPGLLLVVGLILPAVLSKQAPPVAASQRVIAHSRENQAQLAAAMRGDQDEAIALAREHLAAVRVQLLSGAATGLEISAAERDLAIAEARGDARKIAEARLGYAEKRAGLIRERFKTGTASAAEMSAAEIALNSAKTDLLQATPPPRIEPEALSRTPQP